MMKWKSSGTIESLNFLKCLYHAIQGGHFLPVFLLLNRAFKMLIICHHPVKMTLLKKTTSQPIRVCLV